MRIGIRAGHTEKSPGASGIISENKENRPLKNEVIKLLTGNTEIVDLQPSEDMPYPDELMWGINKANDSNLDLAISIHFNNAYKSYEGELGTEVLVHPNCPKKDIARGIVDNLSGLGFKNRGIKEDGKRLAELRESKCPWIIIEVCFVEATRDVELYNNLSYEQIARAIVSGILALDENKVGYVVTNYLPAAYEGYDGVDINYILSYFKDIKTYVRCDKNGIWIETQILTMERCLELKETLGRWFFSIK